MHRPTDFRDVFVQQGTKPSRPSQITEESSETFQEPQNEEENRASPAAPVDITRDVKVEELTLEAFLAQQRCEIRSQEMLSINTELVAEKK